MKTKIYIALSILKQKHKTYVKVAEALGITDRHLRYIRLESQTASKTLEILILVLADIANIEMDK